MYKLEEVLQEIEVLCDKTGKAIAIKPTTLIIRPEMLAELAKLHRITEQEALLLIQQTVIEAYNKYDAKLS